MTIRFFVFRQNVAYLCKVIFISTMRKMYLFAAFISAFVLAACGGDSTSSKVEPVINVTPLELNVSSLGEDKTINVEATCMWEADTDVDWITLSRTKGGIDDRMCVAKIAENNTASSRSATIAFSNSAYALVQRVKVVQDGYTENRVFAVTDSAETELTYMFNRIIDVKEVASVIVDGGVELTVD